MKGAIIGDIIGSPFEFKQVLDESFVIYSDRSDITDDSILTIATASAILENHFDYASAYRAFYNSNKNYRYGPSRTLRNNGTIQELVFPLYLSFTIYLGSRFSAEAFGFLGPIVRSSVNGLWAGGTTTISTTHTKL